MRPDPGDPPSPNVANGGATPAGPLPNGGNGGADAAIWWLQMARETLQRADRPSPNGRNGAGGRLGEKRTQSASEAPGMRATGPTLSGGFWDGVTRSVRRSLGIERRAQVPLAQVGQDDDD
jgi:hypothetical protein